MMRFEFRHVSASRYCAGSEDAAAEPRQGEEVEAQSGKAHLEGIPANNQHGAQTLLSRR